MFRILLEVVREFDTRDGADEVVRGDMMASMRRSAGVGLRLTFSLLTRRLLTFILGSRDNATSSIFEEQDNPDQALDDRHIVVLSL